MVGHVDDFAIHFEARSAQAFDLRGNTSRIDVEHRDARAVAGEGFSETESKPACAASDHDAVAGDREEIGNL